MAGSYPFNEKSRIIRSRIPISSFMKSRVPIQSTVNVIVRDQDNEFHKQFNNKISYNLCGSRNTQNFDFRQRVDSENQNLMRTVSTWEEYKKNLSEPLLLSEIELVISHVRCLMAKFGKFRKTISYWEDGKSDIIDLEEHWKILSFEKDLCYTAIKKLEILKLCHSVDSKLDYVPKEVNSEVHKTDENCSGRSANRTKQKFRKSKKPSAKIDYHGKENEQNLSVSEPLNSTSRGKNESSGANNVFVRSPIKTRSKSSGAGIRKIENLQKSSSSSVLCNCGQKLKTKSVSFGQVEYLETETKVSQKL